MPKSKIKLLVVSGAVLAGLSVVAATVIIIGNKSSGEAQKMSSIQIVSEELEPSSVAPSSESPSSEQPSEAPPAVPAAAASKKPAASKTPESRLPEVTHPKPPVYTRQTVDMSGYTAPDYAVPMQTLQALDNKLRPFGLNTKKKGVRPGVTAAERDLFDRYGGLVLGADNKNVYLTFDCGYENGYTHWILDALKEREVKAVFFLTHGFAKENWQIVERMIREGHTVGGHSVKHKSFPSQTLEQTREEIVSVDRLIYAEHGYKMSYFRFPMGQYSERQIAAVYALGYKSVFWSFAYVDYEVNKQPSQTTALNTMTGRLHNGAIYLLHAISKSNALVLGTFIDRARAEGYQFPLLGEETAQQ